MLNPLPWLGASALALLCLALLLSGCSSLDGFSASRGYALPAACQSADLPPAQFEVYKPRSTLLAMAHSKGLDLRPGETVNGLTFTLPESLKVTWIADDLRGPDLEHTLRHERCHVLLGNFHP